MNLVGMGFKLLNSIHISIKFPRKIEYSALNTVGG